MLNKVFLLALLCVTMQGAPVRKVHVGVLDKVTARVHIQVLDIQEGFSVGRLHGVVQSCHKPNEKAFQKDVARCFVEVYESSVQDATQKKTAVWKMGVQRLSFLESFCPSALRFMDSAYRIKPVDCSVIMLYALT